MQSQLLCSGCRNILLYPRGATNVCCALCNAVTSVPPPGIEISHLYCGSCQTLLMFTHGAPSVKCSCCQTVNLASVKCAVCHYITNSTSNGRIPIPVPRPNGTPNSGTLSSTPISQTVLVENPMSVDASGKLVSNVVVGITADRK
ncbi:protein LSD1-like isoform X2 [Prosopis cineraria]|uniref:protein LSD1-like isoform X2 n=1 Tax=Prosopis cineraria TaxID=364024 RepID=UPI00240EE9E1|nr:protein LSD1-like isoform X2 [Prosopis cineraria]